MDHAESEGPEGDVPAELEAVLESATRLQGLVPDAVLVGGSAAAPHAQHRTSYDHDHVVPDLRARFDIVLEALEAQPDWVTNRVTPGRIVLGEIGNIEAGVRQLIRTTPLETQRVRLPSDKFVTVPTADETLRIKGFLVVKRNQVRDYLDVAAVADKIGIAASATVLGSIDNYYRDETKEGRPVASQLVRQLGDVRPKDSSTLQHLDAYKGLSKRWATWANVVDVCGLLAAAILEGGDR